MNVAPAAVADLTIQEMVAGFPMLPAAADGQETHEFGMAWMTAIVQADRAAILAMIRGTLQVTMAITPGFVAYTNTQLQAIDGLQGPGFRLRITAVSLPQAPPQTVPAPVG